MTSKGNALVTSLQVSSRARIGRSLTTGDVRSRPRAVLGRMGAIASGGLLVVSRTRYRGWGGSPDQPLSQVRTGLGPGKDLTLQNRKTKRRSAAFVITVAWVLGKIQKTEVGMPVHGSP